MFKHQKPASSPRQPNHNLTQRSRGLYYNNRRTLEGDESAGRQSSKRLSSNSNQLGSGDWRKKLPAWLIALGIFGVLIYELGLSAIPKIVILSNASSTSSSFLQPVSVYQQAASQLFRSSITNHIKLTVDSSLIAAKLQKNYPELSSVSITLPLIGRQPTIYIVPATPAIVLNSQTAGTFLISNTGEVLQKIAAAKVPYTDLPVVNTYGDQAIDVGKAVLPETDINFIQLVLAQLKASKLAAQSLTLPANSEELDVSLANLPYYIKFNLNDSADAKQQIGTFLAIWHYLTGKGITPSQYVDVRIVGRAYYK